MLKKCANFIDERSYDEEELNDVDFVLIFLTDFNNEICLET